MKTFAKDHLTFKKAFCLYRFHLGAHFHLFRCNSRALTRLPKWTPNQSSPFRWHPRCQFMNTPNKLARPLLAVCPTLANGRPSAWCVHYLNRYMLNHYLFLTACLLAWIHSVLQVQGCTILKYNLMLYMLNIWTLYSMDEIDTIVMVSFMFNSTA